MSTSTASRRTRCCQWIRSRQRTHAQSRTRSRSGTAEAHSRSERTGRVQPECGLPAEQGQERAASQPDAASIRHDCVGLYRTIARPLGSGRRRRREAGAEKSGNRANLRGRPHSERGPRERAGRSRQLRGRRPDLTGAKRHRCARPALVRLEGAGNRRGSDLHRVVRNAELHLQRNGDSRGARGGELCEPDPDRPRRCDARRRAIAVVRRGDDSDQPRVHAA